MRCRTKKFLIGCPFAGRSCVSLPFRTALAQKHHVQTRVPAVDQAIRSSTNSFPRSAPHVREFTDCPGRAPEIYPDTNGSLIDQSDHGRLWLMALNLPYLMRRSII